MRGDSGFSHCSIRRIVPLEANRSLLVFQVAGKTAALPIESVMRITPMAQLAHPPGMPSALEGILNLGGAAVPVLRLDRLLQLPPSAPTLYSMLIVLQSVSSSPIALLVDRVSGMRSVPEAALVRVSVEDSFNGCAESIVSEQGEAIHVLAPERILLTRERETLSEFQSAAQQRLAEWEIDRQ